MIRSKYNSRVRCLQPILTCNPEDELQFISMTEDLEERYSPDRKNKNKLDIEPWQDEQQNPSQSPERRTYYSKPSVQSKKTEKHQDFVKSLRQPPTKALQSNNNSNFTIRLRHTSSRDENPRISYYNKFQADSGLFNKKSRRESTKKRKTSTCVRNQRTQATQKQYESEVGTFRTQINTVIYPIVNQGNKKRLFRKMEKFQNFVSVSLRK